MSEPYRLAGSREADTFAALVALLEAEGSPLEAAESLLDVLTPALGLAALALERRERDPGRPFALAGEEALLEAALAEPARGEATYHAGLGPGWAVVPLPEIGPAARLCMARAGGEEWAPAERRLLEAAARVAGVALSRAAHRTALEARAAEVEGLVYAVGHDLRGPLVSIEGMGRLLEEELGGDLPPDARFALERIQANVAKLSALVADMLELSRAGRVEGKPQPVPLGGIVAAVLEGWRERLAAAGVAVEAPTAWPTLLHDPARLAQIYDRLVAGALGADRPVTRLWLSWTEEGERAVLSVADDGPSPSPEELERAFEPFARLGEGAVHLAVARRIAEAYGGRAWAEARPGGGTVVRFTAGRAG